jgi:fucose permease
MKIATTAAPTILLLILAYLAFISLGLPDTVTGIAWPGMREAFNLPQSGLGLISIALGSGYVLSSFLGGTLTHKLGVGWLLSLSSLLVTLAMFGQALTPWWLLFLAFSVVLGLGSGAIDAGINTYAASHFSARHVNWLHACYSLGATIGPLIMTAAFVGLGSWRLGYAVVGSLILALTIAFLFTHRRWDAPASTQAKTAPSPLNAALRQPLVWLQIAIFFIYTGLELMVGNWCFTVLTESRSVAAESAGLIASGYFGSIGVGRVLFGAITDRIGVDRLLRGVTLTAMLGAALFVGGSPLPVSLAGLFLLGLSLAPIFPCLMARTPDRLGAALAAHAVGFQVSAATVGSASMSALAGMLAVRLGLESIPQLALGLAVALWLLHELLLLRTRPARMSTPVTL